MDKLLTVIVVNKYTQDIFLADSWNQKFRYLTAIYTQRGIGYLLLNRGWDLKVRLNFSILCCLRIAKQRHLMLLIRFRTSCIVVGFQSWYRARASSFIVLIDDQECPKHAQLVANLATVQANPKYNYCFVEGWFVYYVQCADRHCLAAGFLQYLGVKRGQLQERQSRRIIFENLN